MEVDESTIIKLVEDITETKTILQAAYNDRLEDKKIRAERQGKLDKELEDIKKDAKETKDKLDEHLTVWRTTKRITMAIIGILISIIALDWQQIVANWHNLWG